MNELAFRDYERVRAERDEAVALLRERPLALATGESADVPAVTVSWNRRVWAFLSRVDAKRGAR